MSKKIYSSGYPRKFSDKIALIKQKEALTNAYFESAIQGLSDISVKRLPTNSSFDTNDNKQNIYSLENNINKVKDDQSSASFSPQSFTSESTTNNPHSNDNYHMEYMKDTHNDVFKHVQDFSGSNSFHNLQSFGAIKFRHGSDNSSTQFQQTRLSNIEGYPRFSDSLNRDFNDQVCSGSLPDVSSFNNRNFVQMEGNERHSGDSNAYKDSINLKEVLSNLKNVAKASNSKKALFEHLRSRGIQNQSIHHPHHVPSTETLAQNLTSILGSPSTNRSRTGYIHNYDNSGCAASNSENGHLKHYLPSNSPYLSLPFRDTQSNKDCDSSFRKRHASNNVITPQNKMELDLNCPTDMNSYALKYKSLTPTENIPSSWFNTTNECHLLPPTVYGMISADHCRRVASDSSIQNSLKKCTNNISQTNFVYNNDGNSFGKIRNFRNDEQPHLLQRIKSMTSDPMTTFQDPLNDAMKNYNLQRNISTTSSFLDSYLTPNSPDENIDPNLDLIITPGKHSRQQFQFNEMKEETNRNNEFVNHRCSCITDDNVAPQMTNLAQCFDLRKDDTNQECFDMSYNQENNNEMTNSLQSLEQNDQCYWTQPTDNNSCHYSKEPSPKIKPCENLNPLNVSVDLNTDFGCITIPDIVLSDVDVPRRDSLNMADEVLNNLNMESTTSSTEYFQFRDKLTGYQPMEILDEEVSFKHFENEY